MVMIEITASSIDDALLQIANHFAALAMERRDIMRKIGSGSTKTHDYIHAHSEAYTYERVVTFLRNVKVVLPAPVPPGWQSVETSVNDEPNEMPCMSRFDPDWSASFPLNTGHEKHWP